MNVLLTGSSGGLGRAAAAALAAAGWCVRSFDLAEGQDLRDEVAVRDAVKGCDAVVHAGAIAHDQNGTPAAIVATNVLGTWHVLLGAEAAAVRRVVYTSSAQVFGCAQGEGEPVYLPIDDGHPVRASQPYGMSKRLAEEMGAAWTARTGVPTVVLRPVMVLSGDTLSTIDQEHAEYGAFVHACDVADAITRALSVDLAPGAHLRLTLCGPGAFDSSTASRAQGWRPRYDEWPAPG